MKKTKKSILCLALSCLLFVGTSVFSYAGSHDDWNFNFDFGSLNWTLYTSSRDKEETTPIYCNVTRKTNYDKALVLSAVRGDKTNSTYTPTYKCWKPGVFYLSSNIREDYYNYSSTSTARIKAQKSTYLAVFEASGLWSPDSYR